MLIISTSLIPEVRQFFRRVGDLGETLSSKHRLAYKTLITQLVERGLWAKITATYMFCTQSIGIAVLNLRANSFSIIPSGGPEFTPDLGFVPGSNEGFLICDMSPRMSAGVYGQNSAHLQVYLMYVHQQTLAPVVSSFEVNNSREAALYPAWSASPLFRLTINATAAVQNPGGFQTRTWTGVRESANLTTAYIRGVAQTLNNPSVASSIPPNSPIFLMRNGQGATPGTLINGSRLAHFSIGAALDAGEVAAYSGYLDEFVLALRGSLP